MASAVILFDMNTIHAWQPKKMTYIVHVPGLYSHQISSGQLRWTLCVRMAFIVGTIEWTCSTLNLVLGLVPLGFLDVMQRAFQLAS